eukprot:5545586-Amphidinium_carterae.1
MCSAGVPASKSDTPRADVIAPVSAQGVENQPGSTIKLFELTLLIVACLVLPWRTVFHSMYLREACATSENADRRIK